MSATRLKLVTDPVTGVASWRRRASGELFVQCAYDPTIISHDYCADPPDIPVFSGECGVEVLPLPGIASSDSSTWTPIDSNDGGGGGGVDSSSSSISNSVSGFSSVSSTPSSALSSLAS